MDTSGVIRRLGSFERERIRDHLLRLDEGDRHLRFAGHANAERVSARCAGLDLGRVVVLGSMVAGEARGVGELRPLPGAWPTGWTVLEELEGELCAWWLKPPEGAWPACGARSHRARACADGPSAA